MLVERVAVAGGDTGRPRVPVALDTSYHRFIGLHIGLRRTTGGLVDLAGNVVAERVITHRRSSQNAHPRRGPRAVRRAHGRGRGSRSRPRRRRSHRRTGRPGLRDASCTTRCSAGATCVSATSSGRRPYPGPRRQQRASTGPRRVLPRRGAGRGIGGVPVHRQHRRRRPARRRAAATRRATPRPAPSTTCPSAAPCPASPAAVDATTAWPSSPATSPCSAELARPAWSGRSRRSRRWFASRAPESTPAALLLRDRAQLRRRRGGHPAGPPRPRGARPGRWSAAGTRTSRRAH